LLALESIGSATDVHDAVGDLLSESGLSTAASHAVCAELFRTLGTRSGACARPLSSGDTNFLDCYEWKREFKTHEERFVATYGHDFGATRLVLEQRPFGPEGFASTVWDSSIVLARMLEIRGADALRGRSSIELGAGCGLVGLAAAALGAEMLLTDLPGNLRLLRANVRANSSAVSGGVRVRPLVWGERLADDVVACAPYDLVLATDVFYTREAMPALLASLCALAGETTEVLLAAGRNRHAAADFFELVEPHFAIERCEREDLHPVYQCPDVDVWTLRRLTRSSE